MSATTKRARVLAALRGDDVDRPPVSFWGHDFMREWSAEGLAAAMLESVQAYDYDYLKVNPRATYYSEAWGCRYRPPSEPTRQPQIESWLLYEASDLEKVSSVDGRAGAFAEQLDALRLIGDGLHGDVPFIQTVFSPLSVVGRLANGQEPVRRWMAEAPDALHGALGAVAQTLAGYAAACLEAGADGIFFATTEWATTDVLTLEQYETFGRPYDLRVLQAVEGAAFNVLHVCRPHNMLDRLIDYPVSALSWAALAPGNLSLREARLSTSQALMGGIDERHALLQGSPDDVRDQAAEALAQTGGRGFLLAPGCSISPETPPSNLRAAVSAAKGAPA
jgi:uroporphyrinogen decarboxylase